MNKNTRAYWDAILKRTPENQFPLAPKKLPTNWKPVTKESYDWENNRFGRFCSPLMIRQMEERAKAILQMGQSVGEIHIYGFGSGRDYAWMVPSIRLGFSVRVLDVSCVACDFAKKRAVGSKYDVTEIEILSGLKSGHIKSEGATVIYASQFLEHQGEELPELMHHIGQWLRLPGRTFYCVLHRTEDNPPDMVNFNTAIPLLDHEWLTPLNDGLGGKANFCIIGQEMYFDRKCTFVRVTK